MSRITLVRENRAGIWGGDGRESQYFSVFELSDSKKLSAYVSFLNQNHIVNSLLGFFAGKKKYRITEGVGVGFYYYSEVLF